MLFYNNNLTAGNDVIQEKPQCLLHMHVVIIHTNSHSHKSETIIATYCTMHNVSLTFQTHYSDGPKELVAQIGVLNFCTNALIAFW